MSRPWNSLDQQNLSTSGTQRGCQLFLVEARGTKGEQDTLSLHIGWNFMCTKQGRKWTRLALQDVEQDKARHGITSVPASLAD